jgi:hypothetical protein
VGPVKPDSGIGDGVDEGVAVVDELTVVVRVERGVSEPPHAAAPASASNPTTIEVPSRRVMADMRTTSDSSVRLPHGPVNRFAP